MYGFRGWVYVCRQRTSHVVGGQPGKGKSCVREAHDHKAAPNGRAVSSMAGGVAMAADAAGIVVVAREERESVESGETSGSTHDSAQLPPLGLLLLLVLSLSGLVLKASAAGVVVEEIRGAVGLSSGGSSSSSPSTISARRAHCLSIDAERMNRSSAHQEPIDAVDRSIYETYRAKSSVTSSTRGRFTT